MGKEKVMRNGVFKEDIRVGVISGDRGKDFAGSTEVHMEQEEGNCALGVQRLSGSQLDSFHELVQHCLDLIVSHHIIDNDFLIFNFFPKKINKAETYLGVFVKDDIEHRAESNVDEGTLLRL